MNMNRIYEVIHTLFIILFMAIYSCNASYFNFQGFAEMRGESIVCAETEPCTIICGFGSCESAFMSCPSNHDCNITCYQSGCNDAHITWPTLPGLGHIACSASTACRNIDFPIPSPNESYTLHCNALLQCARSRITCPTHAQCNITCSGELACSLAEIDWPLLPGLGHLGCLSQKSCELLEFPIPAPNQPYNIACSGSNACWAATLKCPTNANCTVSCIGTSACRDSTIEWPIACETKGTLICDPTYDQNPTYPACPMTLPPTPPKYDTCSPTNFPSVSPSPAPSQHPTYSPTAAPTFSPSLAPTNSPSRTPSVSPSGSPTQPPSAIPTYTPSNAPSMTPSASPTSCMDDDMYIISNDGKDYVQNVTVEISRFLFDINHTNDTNNTTQKYENVGFNVIMKCNDDTDLCRIECMEDKSCPQSSVVISDDDLSQLSIECNGNQACYGLTINIFQSNVDLLDLKCIGLESCIFMNILMDDISSDTISMHCTGIRSCESMTITSLKTLSNHYISELLWICEGDNSCGNSEYFVNHTNIEEMTLLCSESYSCNSTTIKSNILDNGKSAIHCVDTYSCDMMSLVLMAPNQTEVDYTNTVICYMDLSCDGLSLSADENINVSMQMYRYSNEIQIIHKQPQKVNIECGNSNDKRFVRYNTNKIKTEKEVIELARDEYTSHHLPCEDIDIICTQNQYFPQQCTMQYQLNPLNISKLVTFNHIGCFWMEISRILTPTCHGSCNEDIQLYPHNSSLELNVYFNTTNHSKDELFAICDERFGSTNATLDTLSTIDGIFGHILDIKFDSFEVYEILNGPYTEFRDNALELNCTKSFHLIRLQTDITIHSGIEDEDEFNELFLNDREFIKTAEQLLSALFGIQVVVQNQFSEMIINETLGWHMRYVILTIIAATSLVIIASFCCHKNYIKTNAMKINNPLVISIAIGTYDDAWYPDLYGIDIDIKNIVSLFQDTFNFAVFPKYKNMQQIRQYWRKKDIIDLLETQSKHLAHNIDHYDGLIVIISCHGMDDCIVTSDGEKIPKMVIHRLFTAMDESHVLNRNIPRLYVFDCCDGPNHFKYHARPIMDTEEKEKTDRENANIKSKSTDYEMVQHAAIEIKRQMSDLWLNGERNPDHKLVIINAANKAFQSKMRTDKGSYFVEAFVEAIYRNNKIGWFGCKNKSYLIDILMRIADALERKGKQLPEYKCNNGTHKIVFVKNVEEHIMMDEKEGEGEEEAKLLVAEESDGDDNLNEDIAMDDYLEKIGDIIMLDKLKTKTVGKGRETQDNYGEVLNELGIDT
eukprot:856498_1